STLLRASRSIWIDAPGPPATSKLHCVRPQSIPNLFHCGHMKRWQFYLTADRKLDLSDVAKATEWAVEVLRGLGFVRDERLLPVGHPISLVGLWAIVLWVRCDTEADRARWVKATHALRSVAGRVEKFRGRKAEIGPLEADRLMAEYLALA